VKIILSLLFCLVLTFAASAQTEPPTGTSGVEKVFLAKDDGTGEAGDESTRFLTTDIPIHCIVQLSSTVATTVSMNLVAVEVKGVKAGTKVVGVAYKTNGRQDRVSFTGMPEGDWTAGKYRVDIFIGGKPAGSLGFEIENAPAPVNGTGSSFQPKATPKPTPKRRSGRN
jgi:hypothetical protein